MLLAWDLTGRSDQHLTETGTIVSAFLPCSPPLSFLTLLTRAVQWTSMEEKKEPITLEQLARLVVEGFARNDERFTALDEKIDREVSSLAAMVKTGFDHVEERFDEVGREIGGLRGEMNARFDGVDARLRNLDNRLDTFATHERRITRLEQEVGIPTVE